MNRHTVLGILAHVDAGKTTLSEGILYRAGAIREAGRVDHRDTFLDTHSIEKERGITVFSKQAEFAAGGHTFTLLDTPGHVDFSPEMERTLQVLDLAILVVSAPEGVNGRVRTLWKLLEHYGVPAVIFVNKMDQAGADREQIYAKLRDSFGDGCVDFQQDMRSEAAQEQLAVCDEQVLAAYLEGVPVRLEAVCRMVRSRQLFPCWFGAALRMEGVDDLLEGLCAYAGNRPAGQMPDDAGAPPEDGSGAGFAARVFKISRDPQGNRLTWIRLFSGSLRVREEIRTGDAAEKTDQIRIYSGDRYEMVQALEPGRVAALTGFSDTYAGQGLGMMQDRQPELMQPVITSAVLLRPGTDRAAVLGALRTLEEEEPLLRVTVGEGDGEIRVGLMGEVQTEILQQILRERFDLDVRFGEGGIAYRETIAEAVEGVGHFEPLRHYAEVHLLLEPGEPGSGLKFAADCSTDHLALNWQRLVLTHLEERPWQGVLTGSDLTDVKITLIGGRAHEKHTEGGDFRQATYRAVRQGLMEARSILLEPVCAYEIRLPSAMVGRAMTDLQRMGGTVSPPETSGTDAVLTGTVPASELRGYQSVLTSYTGGQGELTSSLSGYLPCHNAEEVIDEIGYDPEADRSNPSASVFCAHGAGVMIPWDHVRAYMHVDTGWRPGLTRVSGAWEMPDGGGVPAGGFRDAYGIRDLQADEKTMHDAAVSAREVGEARRKREEASHTFREREQRRSAAEKELKEIFERTYGAVRTQSGAASATLDRTRDEDETSVYDQAWREYRRQQKKERAAGLADGERAAGEKKGRKKKRRRCLLVDGYNIIFAWDDLRDLAQKDIGAARDRLMDILSDYQGYDGCLLILVFDAYRVRGKERHIMKYHNIHVVYTKEAETADAYIEKTVHEMGRLRDVTVATSDSLEQVIILGEGAVRISARELRETITEARAEAKEVFAGQVEKHSFNRLLDHADGELAVRLEELRRGEENEYIK